MAIARVQSAGNAVSATNTTMDITLGAAPTNGNILIVVAGGGGGFPPHITGSADISWYGPSRTGTSSTCCTVLMGRVLTGSASATVTLSIPVSSTSSLAAVCTEFSGFTTPIIDKLSGASATSTTADTGTTITTTANNELWIGGIVTRGTANTLSAQTNGFSIETQQSSNIPSATVDRTAILLYKIVSGTGTANTGGTITSNVYAGQLVAIREAPGSAAVQIASIYG